MKLAYRLELYPSGPSGATGRHGPPGRGARVPLGVDGGDRVIIGIGVSGPQIVEGWYGQPWGHPNERLRDYVQITRKVLDREAPVVHDGREISLPYSGPGSIGQGKPLLGSPKRIRERWPSVVPGGVTGMIVGADQPEALEAVAQAAGTRDLVAADD